MDGDELCYLPASEALRRFRARTLSPVELMEAIIDRCERVNPAVNAFTFTFFDRAMDAAREAEVRYAAGQESVRPLEGIPLAVKDGTPVRDEVTTSGSMIYADHRPESTHPGLARLLDAGAIMIGRTTMPEFGEAGNCYTPLWGVTRNPWNLDFGPGGSSSGAGVAVAAGMTTLADGSDIGGSIRIPAACCGVVGYKAPAGRNPNHLVSTFDPYLHYGPITRTVGDAALMQNVLSGAHVEDVASLRDQIRIPARLPGIRGWRIAYSIDLGYFQIDHDVRRNTLRVVAALRELGCRVEEVEPDWTEEVFQAWKTINSLRGSAARHVKDLESWRPYLADYTADWLDAGAQVAQQEVVRALEVHVEMYRTLGPLLEKYEIFLCPTNCIPSVEAERSPLDLDLRINGEPAKPAVAEAWFMTYPFNMLSQLPVMSVPSGIASSGVPTGIQLVARSYDDVRVFRAAAALEKILQWHQRRPPI